MSDLAEPARLLLTRLQDRDGPWPARVADVLIGYAMRLPAAPLMPQAALVDLVSAALAEASIRHATHHHVKPAWSRQQARAKRVRDTVGDALPPSAVAAIERILERGEGPRFGWLRGAVDPALMAQLIAPIVQQVLLGFVAKLSGNFGSSSASLMGMIGRGVQQRASALADVGKAVMGGIGVDVEKKLHSAAKDFSQTASSTIRDATAARLQSPEGQMLLRRISTQVFAHIRNTPVHVIQDDVAHLPIDEIIDLVPSIVDHNRARALIGEVIREEVGAALSSVGQQSLGDLLDAHGLRGHVEAIARQVVPPTLSDFFAQPDAIALVQDLLQPDAD